MDDKRDIGSIRFFSLDIFFDECIVIDIPLITLNGKTFKISSRSSKLKKFAPFITTISAFNEKTQKETSFSDIGWDDLFEIINSLLSDHDSSLLAGVGITLSINNNSIKYRLTRGYGLEKLEYIQQERIWKLIQQDKKEDEYAIFPILEVIGYRVLAVQLLFQRIPDMLEHMHVYWNQLDKVNKPRVASWIKRPKVENGIQYGWRYLDNESRQWYDVPELDLYVPKKLSQKFPQPLYFFFSSLPKTSIQPGVSVDGALIPQVPHKSPLVSNSLENFYKLYLRHVQRGVWLTGENVNTLLGELFNIADPGRREELSNGYCFQCNDGPYIVTKNCLASGMFSYEREIKPSFRTTYPDSIIITIMCENHNHFVVYVSKPGKQDIRIDPMNLGYQVTDGLFCGVYAVFLASLILTIGWNEFQNEYIERMEQNVQGIFVPKFKNAEIRGALLENLYTQLSAKHKDDLTCKKIICWLSMLYANDLINMLEVWTGQPDILRDVFNNTLEIINSIPVSYDGAAAACII